MDEVVERSAARKRARRAALWAGVVVLVLVLVAVVVWQVVARTARLEPGPVSAWSGPAVASCGIRDDSPSAYVVGAEDDERRVVYSVHNPGIAPVLLTGDDLVRFQAGPYDPERAVAPVPTEDLVGSVQLDPGGTVLVQVEGDSQVASAMTRLRLTFEAEVLGVGRPVFVELVPILLVIPGTSDGTAWVELHVARACGDDAGGDGPG